MVIVLKLDITLVQPLIKIIFIKLYLFFDPTSNESLMNTIGLRKKKKIGINLKPLLFFYAFKNIILNLNYLVINFIILFVLNLLIRSYDLKICTDINCITLLKSYCSFQMLYEKLVDLFL